MGLKTVGVFVIFILLILSAMYIYRVFIVSALSNPTLEIVREGPCYLVRVKLNNKEMFSKVTLLFNIDGGVYYSDNPPTSFTKKVCFNFDSVRVIAYRTDGSLIEKEFTLEN